MYACTCVYALIGEHQNRIKTSKFKHVYFVSAHSPLKSRFFDVHTCMYACTCVYALIGEHQNRIKTSKTFQSDFLSIIIILDLAGFSGILAGFKREVVFSTCVGVLSSVLRIRFHSHCRLRRRLQWHWDPCTQWQARRRCLACR